MTKQKKIEEAEIRDENALKDEEERKQKKGGEINEVV